VNGTLTVSTDLRHPAASFYSEIQTITERGIFRQTNTPINQTHRGEVCQIMDENHG
jgi:hypothetical protein